MGGLGSGRQSSYGAAPITDDYRRLDVRRWQRDGFLSPGRVFGWHWSHNDRVAASINVRADSDRVILSYRHRMGGDAWEHIEYPVWLDWTPCNYGGSRAWFRCPAKGCGRRVAVLYGGSVFACRQCHRLVYRSQRERAHDRAISRADKIRARLGWEAGIVNPGGDKPKGMHWRTFDQLLSEHDKLVEQSFAGILARLGKYGCDDPFV